MNDKSQYAKGINDGFIIGALIGSITSTAMFVVLWYLTH
jgi:hypothetical protein